VEEVRGGGGGKRKGLQNLSLCGWWYYHNSSCNQDQLRTPVGRQRRTPSIVAGSRWSEITVEKGSDSEDDTAHNPTTTNQLSPERGYFPQIHELIFCINLLPVASQTRLLLFSCSAPPLVVVVGRMAIWDLPKRLRVILTLT